MSETVIVTATLVGCIACLLVLLVLVTRPARPDYSVTPVRTDDGYEVYRCRTPHGAAMIRRTYDDDRGESFQIEMVEHDGHGPRMHVGYTYPSIVSAVAYIKARQFAGA